MNQAHRLLDLFHEHGNRLTLGQILDARISSKYTNRISDLRKMGYSVTCEEHRDSPTDNLYTLFEPKEGQFQMFAGASL